jgi:DNA-binding MarR family transcriptional regulator
MKPDHTQAALDSLRRIVQSLRLSSRAAEKRFGLSGAQLFVLQKLGDGRALSLNELAARTRTHQSSVSVVVRRLVERGLVASSPSGKDARRVELTLRPAGRKFLRKDPALPQERLAAAIEALPSAQRSRLAALLSRVAAKAGLAEQPPSMFFAEIRR